MSNADPVSQHERIPALDGLRALAIGIVLVSHVSELIWRNASFLAIVGGDGVTLFFSISGFLITTLLLRELSVSGKISIRDFYVRRVFRMLPAAFVYLAAVAALAIAGIIVLKPGELYAAALFFANYWPSQTWYTAHFWSLSIEEQFYIAWPFLLSRMGSRASILAFGIAIITPLWRLARVFPLPFLDPMHRTDYRIDTFGVACGLAIVCYYRKPRWLKSGWTPALGFSLWIVTMVLPHTIFLKPLATGMIVVSTASQPGNALVRILD